ncbi:hypothetical protein GKR41_00741 [Candidatus Vallotia lariciata]|nr:hypothetical protein GKR41_00741 [Candidatus Vallotia lariciata]
MFKILIILVFGTVNRYLKGGVLLLIWEGDVIRIFSACITYLAQRITLLTATCYI